MANIVPPDAEIFDEAVLFENTSTGEGGFSLKREDALDTSLQLSHYNWTSHYIGVKYPIAQSWFRQWPKCPMTVQKGEL